MRQKREETTALTILLVDDDKIASLLTQKILQIGKLKGLICPFDSAEYALAYLMENQKREGTFLLFLDLNMPGMNGWDFLKSCSKSWKNPPLIVVLSSSTSTADRTKALTHPLVIEFFNKPFTLDNLEKIKEELIRRDIHVNPFCEPSSSLQPE